MQELNNDNFSENVENSKGIVLVDFWASWCSFCPAVKANVLKFSNENNIASFAVDADQNQDILKKYKIKSLPTVLLFKDGILIDTKMGSHSLSDLTKFVEKNS